MGKVIIEIDKKEIEKAIKNLNFEDKVKILKKLARETRKERWGNLICQIRKKVKENPIRDEDIREICEIVRNRIYEKKVKGCS